nr:DUF3575 domain-containing protein [Chitinophagaceae bacterium]
MMKKYTLLLFFILIGSTIFSQNKWREPKLIAKIQPLAFVDFISFPSTMLGMEYFANKRYSVDASAGIIFAKETLHGEKGNGYKSKLELRRYFRKIHKNGANLYCSIEGIVNKVNYRTYGSYSYSMHGATYIDSFRLMKNIIGCNFKFGLLLFKSKKISLDVYSGFGYRFKHSEAIDKFNIKAYSAYHHPTIDNTRDEIGSTRTGSFILGVKIGYLIF